MTYSGRLGGSFAAAYLGVIGMLAVQGCDRTDVLPGSIRSAEPSKSSFGPHEVSAAFPDYVKANQQRPQEEKLLVRLLEEPGHFFEIYQDQNVIFYSESAPAGVEPFPLTQQEKRELTPKSIWKRIAEDLPVPPAIERAEAGFKKEVEKGKCIENSNGLTYCPRSDSPKPGVNRTEPRYEGQQAPGLDGGDNPPMQADTNPLSASEKHDQASNADERVIRPAILSSDYGYYTGCPWDWFRASKCHDPPWEDTDWSGCLPSRIWAFAEASSVFDFGAICTVSGGVNLEYYFDDELWSLFYVPADMWRSIEMGPRMDCGCFFSFWDPCFYEGCHREYVTTKYNIPPYPNGPQGVFHFSWAMDTQ